MKSLRIPLLCALALGAVGCGSTHSVLPPVADAIGPAQGSHKPASSRALPGIVQPPPDDSGYALRRPGTLAPSSGRALPGFVEPPPDDGTAFPGPGLAPVAPNTLEAVPI